MTATHFICQCGEFFPKDEASYVNWTECALCPACDSDELDDAWMCEHCLMRRADESGTDLCTVCAREEEKLAAMWDQNKETQLEETV